MTVHPSSRSTSRQIIKVRGSEWRHFTEVRRTNLSHRRFGAGEYRERTRSSDNRASNCGRIRRCCTTARGILLQLLLEFLVVVELLFCRARTAPYPCSIRVFATFRQHLFLGFVQVIDSVINLFSNDFFKGCYANRRGGTMAVRLRTGQKPRDMQYYGEQGFNSRYWLPERDHNT